MLKKRILILLGVLLFVVFLLALIALSAQKESPTTIIITPSAPHIEEATPTVAPILPSQLSIVSHLPSQTPIAPYDQTQKITLVFSDTITPALLKYEVLPEVLINVIQGKNPRTLLLIPRTSWGKGQIGITILQSTRSTNGKPLFAPFTYNLLTDTKYGPEIEYLGVD